ncbi:troponin I, fast skeletal muscle-like [Anarrhichthys ocellatus]|uniref:troponin I, fast skeletal muscle-like n=1 Tax=Anarrhichthys ocellatus TaxID=433405 RepID=UPI0012EE90B6|nr:troponin I, fast skeletal muscle-like [Anarrhichthys ocellatus]
MSSGRRNQLKTLLLQIGEAMLEEEVREAEQQKIKHMEENCPGFFLPGCMHELQDFCRKLHKQIDLVDEERYDMEVKVTKTNKEVRRFQSFTSCHRSFGTVMIIIIFCITSFLKCFV